MRKIFGFFISKRKFEMKPIFITVVFAAFMIIANSISVTNADSVHEPISVKEGQVFADIRLMAYSEEMGVSVKNLFFTVSLNPYYTNIADSFRTKTSSIEINGDFHNNINITDTIRLPEGKYYIMCNVPTGFDRIDSGVLEISVDEKGNVTEENGNTVIKEKSTNVYIVRANLLNTRRSGIILTDRQDAEFEFYMSTYEKVTSQKVNLSNAYWKKYDKDLKTDKDGKTEPVPFMPNSKYRYMEKTPMREVPFVFSFETDSECNIINAKMTGKTKLAFGREYSMSINRSYKNDSDRWYDDGSIYFFFEKKDIELKSAIYRFVLI